MPRPKLQRTPKVFSSSYQVPNNSSGGFVLRFGPLAKLLVTLLALFLLSRLPVFRIKSVSVTGDTNDRLTENLAKLDGTTIFSSKIKRLSDQLINDDKSLATVSCRKGLPNSLTCNITRRQPALIWQSRDKLFLVDANGLLYQERTDDSFKGLTLVDQASQPVTIGLQVVSSEVISQIQKLNDLLTKSKIDVSRYYINDSVYQIGATVNSFMVDGQPVTKNINILFVTTQPLEAQIKSLIALLNQKGKSINSQVDLRIPGYVYFK